MEGKQSIEIVKVYELHGEALYDLKINGQVKMKTITMETAIKCLSNMHEDESDEY